MRRFVDIIDLAAERRGGREALERMLSETRPSAPQDVAASPDDRILAAMTRRLFSAGCSWKVVDKNCEAFETAFERFDPTRRARMTEERVLAAVAVDHRRRLEPDAILDAREALRAG